MSAELGVIAKRALERAKLVVAGAYARRHANAETLALMESLEREDVSLRTSLEMKKRDESHRTGHLVYGRALAASIAGLAIATLLFWLNYTAEGSCFRRGFTTGNASTALRPPPQLAAGCRSHGGSILSGMTAPTPADDGVPKASR